MLQEEDEGIPIEIDKPNALKIKALVAISAMMMLDSVAYTLLLETGTEYDGKLSHTSSNFIPHTTNATKSYYFNFLVRVTWYTKPKPSGFRNACCVFRSLSLILNSLFSNALIERVTCFWTMMIGSGIMFISTIVLGVIKSNVSLLIGSILEGLGSAFVNIGGCAIITTLFNERRSRTNAFAVMIGIQGFGNLVISPLLGFLFISTTKLISYIILASTYLLTNVVLSMIFIRMKKTYPALFKIDHLSKSPSFCQLTLDTYILLRAVLLLMSTELFLFHYFKDDKPRWMNNRSNNWIPWISSYIPHVLGTGATVIFLKRYSRYKIMIICAGLVLVSFFCFLRVNELIRAIYLGFAAFFNAFAAAILLPKFAQYMDMCHIYIYGNAYAIVNIAVNLPYAVRHVLEHSLYDIIFMGCLKLAQAAQGLFTNVVMGLLRPLG